MKQNLCQCQFVHHKWNGQGSNLNPHGETPMIINSMYCVSWTLCWQHVFSNASEVRVELLNLQVVCMKNSAFSDVMACSLA
jgi:hypothetical protein